MLKTGLLAFIRAPFDALDDVTSDETTRQNTYTGIRTSQEGHFSITSTQPGTGLYAAQDGGTSDEPTADSNRTFDRRETFDCADPATCATC